MSLLAPGLDAREHVSAILAALNATLAPNKAYTYDKVPGSPYMKTDGAGGKSDTPRIYAAIHVERRPVPVRRNDGTAGRTSWRAQVRFVGTTVAEAQWCQLRGAQALNESRIAVAGRTSSPIQCVPNTAPTWDGERWSGLDDYEYSI